MYYKQRGKDSSGKRETDNINLHIRGLQYLQGLNISEMTAKQTYGVWVSLETSWKVIVKDAF